LRVDDEGQVLQYERCSCNLIDMGYPARSVN